MSAASNALRVLEHLAATPHAVTSQELASALGIPRSTLSDLMAELRSLGYVEQVGRRYAPGVDFALLAYRMSRRLGSPPAIHETLQRLAADTGETALYCVEIGGDTDQAGKVLIVEQVASTNPIRYVASVFPPRSLRETASGRVLLAFSNRNGDDGEPLANEIARAREQGYYVNVAGSGATSIAAPVFSAQGQLVGALAVTGPSGRMTDAVTRILPHLKAATASLKS